MSFWLSICFEMLRNYENMEDKLEKKNIKKIKLFLSIKEILTRESMLHLNDSNSLVHSHSEALKL